MRRSWLLVTALLGACSTEVSLADNARCDGIAQPSEDVVDAPFDRDEDGFFDAANAECAQNYPADRLDCDDGDPAVNPGAAELACNGVDDDCTAATIDAEDLDGDGSPSCEDCDDADADNAPGGVEVCDGRDNDCNGLADGGAPGTADAEVDGDGDGASVCEGDCDDLDAANRPGGPELCDGRDNDCNGLDDAGAPGVPGQEIDDDGDGLTACAGDCDDTRDDVFPGAAEVCDGVDNDCAPATTAPGGESDGDGDGWVPCEDWVGPLTLDGGGDCADADPAVSPAATEVCNGLDDDCDGSVDNAVGANATPWFADADGDGWGDPSAVVYQCDPPADHVASDGDCDDGDAAVYPGAPELCDLNDNDCDVAVDEGTSSIGGMLTADTTLDLAGSPWCLSSDVQVGPGVRLTVDASVVVDGQGYTIRNFGTVAIEGLPGQHAHLYDVHLEPGATSPGQDYLFDLDHLWLHRGSLYGPTGNAVYGRIELVDSILDQPTDYIYLWYPTGPCRFERNVFVGLATLSIGTDGDAVDVRNNVFWGWSGTYAVEEWAAYNAAPVVLTGNSFLGSGYAVGLPPGYSSAAMTAVGNWWGTTDLPVIEAMIFDQTDDFASAGFVPFQPFLLAPDPATPDPTPYLP